MNEIILQNTAIEPAFNESLFNRFIQYTDVKETTLKGYTVCLRQFFVWLQDNEIRQPKRDDIKAYKKHLEESEFTAGTKAQYLRAVKHFFKWTASEGLYSNIAENIKGAKVKQDNTKKEAFSESDIRQILDSIDTSDEIGLRNYCLILLAVTGGLRIIELQRADVGDLQTLRGQEILYIQGKGRDEKDEYIKIVPKASEALNKYLSYRPTRRKNEPLFAGVGNRHKAGRLSEPSLSRIIKGIFIDAGYDCDKLTAHSLRHTSNTLLFKSGADLYTVQRHARHSDPKTTEIYIHAVERENDTSEQDIYNRIFNAGTTTAREEATEILRSLQADDLENILGLLRGLQTKGDTA